MNFLIFQNFLDFILIFRHFSRFNSFKKGQKGFNLSHGTREADVVQGGHMAEPRKAIRTLMWRTMIGLANDGPTG